MKRFILSVLVLKTMFSLVVPAKIIAQGGLDLARDRSASIQGRVTASDGTALSASILVYGRAIIDGRVDLFAMCSTTTDLAGKYICADLRPGEYIVSVTAKPVDPSIAKESTLLVSSPRTFFPGTPHLEEANFIELAHGVTAFADVMMTSSKPGKIRGKLSGLPPKPSFLFRAYYGQFELPFAAQVIYDPVTGIFTVSNLPPGTFSLSVDWWNGTSMHHEYGIVSVSAGKETILSTQEVSRHKVTGRLHLPESDLQQEDYPAAIVLLGVGLHSGWRLEASVATDGSFSFPEINDGEYAIQTKGDGGWYVDSIDGTPSKSTANTLKLTSGSTHVEISLLLKRTTARISGKVDADEVVPNKTGAVLKCLRDDTITTDTVDQYGRFSFVNLAPGEYRVFLWKDLSKAEFRNPNVLASQKDHGLDLYVDNDSNLTNVEGSLLSSSR